MRKLIMLFCSLLILGGCSSSETGSQEVDSNLSIEYFNETSYTEIEKDYSGKTIVVKGVFYNIEEGEISLYSLEDPERWAFFKLNPATDTSSLTEGDIVVVRGVYDKEMDIIQVEKNTITSDPVLASEEAEIVEEPKEPEVAIEENEGTEVIEDIFNEAEEESTESKESVLVTEEVVEEEEVRIEDDPLDGLAFTDFEIELLSEGSEDNPVASYKVYFSIQNNSDSIQYIDEDSFVVKNGGDVATLAYLDYVEIVPEQIVDYEFWIHKRTDNEDMTSSIVGFTMNYVKYGKLYPITTF